MSFYEEFGRFLYNTREKTSEDYQREYVDRMNAEYREDKEREARDEARQDRFLDILEIMSKK